MRARASAGLATSILILAFACGGGGEGDGEQGSGPAASAAAVEPPCEGVEEPDKRALIGLLEAHRFEELDAEFRRLQKVVETNKACELRAWRGLATFNSSLEALHPHLDAWVEAMPEAWSARVGRAAHLRAAGFARRGNRVVGETPPEALATMRKLFAKAQPDLQRALELEPRHLPAYLHGIAIASATGELEERDRVLAAALEADPASFAFLDQAMQWYDSSWGGSVEDLRRIAKEAQRHLDANPRLVRLLAVRDYLEARALRRAGREEEAIERYEQAIAIYPAHPSTWEIFALLRDRKQNERLIQAANRVEEWWTQRDRHAGGWVFAYRGVAYWRIGNRKRARADLERATQLAPRDAWVQTQWAWFVEATEGAAAALPHYERAWALDTRDPWLTERFAEALQTDPTRRAEAAPVLRRRTELEPESPRAWLAYGTLLHELGDDDARGALERYLALADPSDPQTEGRNQAVVRMLAGDAEGPGAEVSTTELPALGRVTAMVEARRAAGLSAGTR